jgi:hypothetical protein
LQSFPARQKISTPPLLILAVEQPDNMHPVLPFNNFTAPLDEEQDTGEQEQSAFAQSANFNSEEIPFK